jgi:hypothetical protein
VKNFFSYLSRMYFSRSPSVTMGGAGFLTPSICRPSHHRFTLRFPFCFKNCDRHMHPSPTISSLRGALRARVCGDL